MNEPGGWNCVWKCRTATPVHLMSFSPDGTLFATTGLNDRLVKIWFENKNRKLIKKHYYSIYIYKNINYLCFIVFPMRGIDHHGGFGSSIPNDSYSFVYIAHPRAVTHLSWRKTSKYMPK